MTGWSRGCSGGRRSAVLISAALAVWSAGAQGAEPVCEQVRQLAEAVYASTAPRLYAPQVLPEPFAGRWQLGALQADISAGAPLHHGGVFVHESDAQGRDRYVTQANAQGQQLVVEQQPRGWQGDVYSARWRSLAAPDALLLEDSWRPPLVFTSDQGLWLVTLGEPYQVLAPWRVFSADSAQPACVLGFRPPASALPAAVDRLTALLDQALGPGLNEGTLQPTARIRLAAAHLLGNLAQRPWALDATAAYNRRATVDAALREWADQAPEHWLLLDKLDAHYAPAEQALADYYQKVFGAPDDDAQQMAAWVLDLLYRVWFVFPAAESQPVSVPSSNPWPAHLRPETVVEDLVEDD
ncbi:MAG: hypothetical protein CMK74_17855 [Pseudomonadales bacterium]|nr:hypothetical protein [Pseudomonadales bacterium]